MLPCAKQWVNNVCLGERRGAFLAICNQRLGSWAFCETAIRSAVSSSWNPLRDSKRSFEAAWSPLPRPSSSYDLRGSYDTLFHIFHASYGISFISMFDTIYFCPVARIISSKSPVECNLNGNGCEELCRFDERMCIILVAGTCERLESQLAIRTNEPREKLVRRN